MTPYRSLIPASWTGLLLWAALSLGLPLAGAEPTQGAATSNLSGYAGVWKRDSTDAAYTLRVEGDDVTLDSVVDNDGEVYVVTSSYWDGEVMRWKYKVPSTGYVLMEEVRLQDNNTLSGTYTSTAPNGASTKGNVSWARVRATPAREPVAARSSLVGVWKSERSGAIYTIGEPDGVHGVVGLISIVDDNGEVFEVEESVSQGLDMSWTYKVPSTGYVVTEEVELGTEVDDDEWLIGDWTSTAPDGAVNRGIDSWMKAEPSTPETAAGPVGVWRATSNGSIFTVINENGTPKLNSVVEADGDVLKVFGSTWAGGVLRCKYGWRTQGTVQVAARLRGPNLLAVNWTQKRASGESGGGNSDTWTRIDDPVLAGDRPLGAWKCASSGAVYTIVDSGTQSALLNSIVDDNGEVWEVQESSWNDGVMRWKFRMPSSGYTIQEAVRRRGQNGLTGNWTSMGPNGNGRQGSDTWTRIQD